MGTGRSRNGPGAWNKTLSVYRHENWQVLGCAGGDGLGAQHGAQQRLEQRLPYKQRSESELARERGVGSLRWLASSAVGRWPWWAAYTLRPPSLLQGGLYVAYRIRVRGTYRAKLQAVRELSPVSEDTRREEEERAEVLR